MVDVAGLPMTLLKVLLLTACSIATVVAVKTVLESLREVSIRIRNKDWFGVLNHWCFIVYAVIVLSLSWGILYVAFDKQ